MVQQIEYEQQRNQDFAANEERGQLELKSSNDEHEKKKHALELKIV